LGEQAAAVKEIQAKSILRRHRGVDAWFLGGSGMNLYRGCAHDCAYCDGRAEKYRVEGHFADEVCVKSNALEILRQELPPAADPDGYSGGLFPDSPVPRGRRSKRVSGFMILGGGVGDSYQPAEAECRLSRGALELLEERGLPVHVLTKSTLVLRDAEILARINAKTRAVVSFSISTVDDELAAVFEPGASPPSDRLAALARLKSLGISCGVFLLPVIPFVSDSGDAIEESVRAARGAGADFTAFGGMTLKEGRQKEHFFGVLKRVRPDLVEPCRKLYANRARYGEPAGGYFREIGGRFAAASARYGMPPRMPRPLFAGRISGIELAMILMEHSDAMLALEGKSSSYRRVAAGVARFGKPVTPDNASEITGIGGAAAAMIREILETGTSRLYEDLLSRRSSPASR
jgi:DNA repair photolyase